MSINYKILWNENNDFLEQEVPAPTNTFFVSYAYNGYQSPYFSNIQDAINECDGVSYYDIIVFAGTYIETLTLKDRVHLHFENNTRLHPVTGNSGIIFPDSSTNISITGNLDILSDLTTAHTGKYTIETKGGLHKIELKSISNTGNATYPIRLNGNINLNVMNVTCPIELVSDSTGEIKARIVNKIKNNGAVYTLKSEYIDGQIWNYAGNLYVYDCISKVTNGVAFKVESGELVLNGCTAKEYSESSTAIVEIKGGLTRIKNCYLKHTSDFGSTILQNYNSTNTNLILVASTLISGSHTTAFSIKSNFLTYYSCYGSNVYTNRPTDLNTNYKINSIVVSTDVI